MTSASEEAPLKERWGYIDRDGKVVIPFLFEDAESFSEGLAVVKCQGKAGCINRAGHWVIPPEFKRIDGFNGNLSSATREDKWGLIDRSGQFVISPKYDFVDSIFHDGLAQVKIDDLYGYIDRTGHLVIPARYKSAYDFADGFARIRHSKKGPCFIDRKGKITLGPFVEAEDFSEGWAGVLDLEGRGFIDTKGKVVLRLPPNVVADCFREGVARAGDDTIDPEGDTVWGYIDRKGEWIIEPQFDRAGYFRNGTAVVDVQGNDGLLKSGLIDKTGQYVIPPRYEYLDNMFENRAEFEDGKFNGYLDERGQVVIEPRYAITQHFSEGLAAVCLRG